MTQTNIEFKYCKRAGKIELGLRHNDLYYFSALKHWEDYTKVSIKLD